MIPGCSSQRERRGRLVSQGEDAGDCHLVGWDGGLTIVSAVPAVLNKDCDSIEMF